MVLRTQHSAIGDCAFAAAAPSVWNGVLSFRRISIRRISTTGRERVRDMVKVRVRVRVRDRAMDMDRVSI